MISTNNSRLQKVILLSPFPTSKLRLISALFHRFQPSLKRTKTWDRGAIRPKTICWKAPVVVPSLNIRPRTCRRKWARTSIFVRWPWDTWRKMLLVRRASSRLWAKFPWCRQQQQRLCKMPIVHLCKAYQNLTLTLPCKGPRLKANCCRKSISNSLIETTTTQIQRSCRRKTQATCRRKEARR